MIINKKIVISAVVIAASTAVAVIKKSRKNKKEANNTTEEEHVNDIFDKDYEDTLKTFMVLEDQPVIKLNANVTESGIKSLKTDDGKDIYLGNYSPDDFTFMVDTSSNDVYVYINPKEITMKDKAEFVTRKLLKKGFTFDKTKVKDIKPQNNLGKFMSKLKASKAKDDCKIMDYGIYTLKQMRRNAPIKKNKLKTDFEKEQIINYSNIIRFFNIEEVIGRRNKIHKTLDNKDLVPLYIYEK